MQNNELESKMMKQIGISLEALNWFILSGWIKSIVTDPEKVKVVFSSAEDCQAIEVLLHRINKQFAPNIDKIIDQDEEKVYLENLLQLPPKKIIAAPKPIIV
jgi:CRISPR/Cas system CSM-associated protein Csm2 small subunit